MAPKPRPPGDIKKLSPDIGISEGRGSATPPSNPRPSAQN